MAIKFLYVMRYVLFLFFFWVVVTRMSIAGVTRLVPGSHAFVDAAFADVRCIVFCRIVLPMNECHDPCSKAATDKNTCYENNCRHHLSSPFIRSHQVLFLPEYTRASLQASHSMMTRNTGMPSSSRISLPSSVSLFHSLHGLLHIDLHAADHSQR